MIFIILLLRGFIILNDSPRIVPELSQLQPIRFVFGQAAMQVDKRLEQRPRSLRLGRSLAGEYVHVKKKNAYDIMGV